MASIWAPLACACIRNRSCRLPGNRSIAFDPATGMVSGAATALANVVGFHPSTYWANLAAAQNGTLVYNTLAGAPLSVLAWMDRSGKELGRVGDPGIVANPTLSPDGSRVAVDISDQKANNVDVWLESTNGAGNARFTFNPEEDVNGVWSRDGSMIAYRSSTAYITIFVKRATGLEGDKPLFKVSDTQQDIIPNSWSPDNKQILCTAEGASEWHLELVSVAGGTSAHFLPTRSNQSNGQISPDGKWAAYASDESGNWEVYVTSFSSAAGKWQVSRGGGTEPRWSGDGKEIFYIGTGAMLMAAPVSGDSGFVSRTPEPLFRIRGRAPISSTDISTYDAAKDGKRFLVNRYVKPEHSEPLVILLHATQSN